MVGRVDHHGVAGPQDRADAAQVRLVPGGEHDGVLGAHPFRQLALELQVRPDGPVEQPRAGEARPVALQRVARALLDPLVAGEPQVVVGPEHHALGALHLHHREGRRLQQPEVGKDVGLPRRGQLIGALVIPDLGEDVGGGRHIRFGAHGPGDPPCREPSRPRDVHPAALADLS